MGLRIQNNIEAFNTHRQLTATAYDASKSMEKLSSGYRINRAADDAAGLGISEKMRGQIGGLAQAQRNAQDGVSLVQTAEGALNEGHSMLQRVRDLKGQFNNGTNESNEKLAIASEVGQIAKEVKDIVGGTKFNGQTVFGSSDSFTFQVGANDNETISTAATTLSSGSITNGGLSDFTNLAVCVVSDVATALDTGAFSAIDTLDTAIANIAKARYTYGRVQNRLEHRLNNLANYQENLTASESRIRDVDMASEMTKFTKLNILQQAGTSMLAQANQSGQGVLSLLR